MIIIDKTRCKRDGLCVDDCPMAIIHPRGKESVPEMVTGGDQMCLRCGHCVAICPHGALSHVEVPLETCPPIRRKDVVTHEQAVQLLRSRRSVRLFKDQPVERDAFQKLIKIASYAPTARNAQLLRWVVVSDRNMVRDLAEQTVDWIRKVLEKDPQPDSAPYMPRLVAAWDMNFDALLRNAPGLVIATAPKENPNGMVDLTLALSYLELAAPSLGLGTCWAGLLQEALLSKPSLKRVAGIPEGFDHHYPMMIGHAKTRYYRLPERKNPQIDWR